MISAACQFTRGELIDIARHGTHGPAFNMFFFQTKDNAPLHLHTLAIDDGLVRCMKCGCTIDEHNSATDQTIAEQKMWGACVAQEAFQGIAGALCVHRVGEPVHEGNFAVLDSVLADTGCMYTCILPPKMFDQLVDTLNLSEVHCCEPITGGETLNSFVLVTVRLQELNASNDMRVYRSRSDDRPPLLGLPALELLHIAVSPTKQLFKWSHTSVGYMVRRGSGTVVESVSPLTEDHTPHAFTSKEHAATWCAICHVHEGDHPEYHPKK
jgi:predicted aspartyl protease